MSIEIKTDEDAKKLIGELVWYPGCGLLGVAEAKLADGKLYIAPATGFMFHRVDRPADLRVLKADPVTVSASPRVRRDFSGLLPLSVVFIDGGCQVRWGSEDRSSGNPSHWPILVVDLLAAYARRYNLCFPKDTEVRVEIAGALTTLRLDRDVG